MEVVKRFSKGYSGEWLRPEYNIERLIDNKIHKLQSFSLTWSWVPAHTDLEGEQYDANRIADVLASNSHDKNMGTTNI